MHEESVFKQNWLVDIFLVFEELAQHSILDEIN